MCGECGGNEKVVVLYTDCVTVQTVWDADQDKPGCKNIVTHYYNVSTLYSQCRKVWPSYG